jgi:hypothetical protein
MVDKILAFMIFCSVLRKIAYFIPFGVFSAEKKF